MATQVRQIHPEGTTAVCYGKGGRYVYVRVWYAYTIGGFPIVHKVSATHLVIVVLLFLNLLILSFPSSHLASVVCGGLACLPPLSTKLGCANRISSTSAFSSLCTICSYCYV